MKHLVLVGAGHAHVGVLRAFGLQPIPGIKVTLISRQMMTPYSGMLPGLIAGQYSFDEAHIDVRPLCAFAGASLIHSEVMDVDLIATRVHGADGREVPFDLLSINTGSTPNIRDVPGSEVAIAVKPVDGFLRGVGAMRESILSKKGRGSICVVGAGAGGIELLLALERRLRRDIGEAGFGQGSLSFAICSASAEILAGFPRRFRSRLEHILQTRGVRVITDANVTRIEAGTLHFKGQPPLAADHIVWATDAAAPAWLAETGLKLDSKGFMETHPTLESVSHAGVFAAGDVAAFRANPLPKAGVYAVRQGPVLAGNLRRAAAGKPLKAYAPQRHALFLISTGERYAIGTRNGIVFEGAWVWRWKDWIDRRFMKKFKFLPAAMPQR